MYRWVPMNCYDQRFARKLLCSGVLMFCRNDFKRAIDNADSIAGYVTYNA